MSGRAFKELLVHRIRVQDPKHPKVLSTRYAIAVRTRDTDAPERATAVCRELMLDSIRVLGEQHPHTGWPATGSHSASATPAGLDQALEQLAIVHTTWINRFGPKQPAGDQGPRSGHESGDEVGVTGG